MDLIAMLNQSSAVAKAFRMARDWCAAHDTSNFQLRLIRIEQVHDSTTPQVCPK